MLELGQTPSVVMVDMSVSILKTATVCVNADNDNEVTTVNIDNAESVIVAVVIVLT